MATNFVILTDDELENLLIDCDAENTKKSYCFNFH